MASNTLTRWYVAVAAIALSATSLGAQTLLPNDPALSANLALWLRGDQLTTSGTNVTQWLDQSGQGNDTSTVGGAPQFVASAAAFNNQPVVTFSGNYFRINQNLLPANNDVTIFSVARSNVGAAADNLNANRVWSTNINSSSSSTLMAVGQNTNQVNYSRRTDATTLAHVATGAVIDTARPFISVFAQGTSTNQFAHWVNGVITNQTGSFTFPGSESGPNTHFWVGAQAGGAERFWAGDIGEVIVFDRQLSAVEISGVNQYLAQRYGLSRLTNVSTQVNGNRRDLTSISTLERGTINAADFVGVDVFHWHAASNTNSAYSPGATDPGAGNRASLMEDLSLNTGLINPGALGGANTLSAAQQASLGPANNTINGLGVTFEGGLLNGPGIDLVVFEIAPTSAEVDSFYVNRIDGIVGSLLIEAADYSLSGANSAGSTVTTNSGSLSLLESTATWTAGTASTQTWNAVGIDLSDLGYLPFQIAPGLHFSGATVDFVAIAALPFAQVPEPRSWLLFVIAAMGCIAASLIADRNRRSR
jgi:hypothetical protein